MSFPKPPAQPVPVKAGTVAINFHTEMMPDGSISGVIGRVHFTRVAADGTFVNEDSAPYSELAAAMQTSIANAMTTLRTRINNEAMP